MANVSIPIPSSLLSGVLGKLDALKDKFLAVPANTRAALDKLARIRMTINASGSVPADVNTGAMLVENNLKRVQSEWQTSADRFAQLDNARRSGGVLSMDTLTIASSLVISAGYVLKNADSSIAAVDGFASKYLSPEQRDKLDISTTGTVAGISPVVLIGGLAALWFLSRRRR